MPNNDTWKPISEVIQELRAKADAWLIQGNFELAETYHEEATSLALSEWMDCFEQGDDE